MATIPSNDHNIILYISQAQYRDLEKKAMTNTYVGHETSPLEVSFQLGIQHVLKLVREGFVRG